MINRIFKYLDSWINVKPNIQIHIFMLNRILKHMETEDTREATVVPMENIEQRPTVTDSFESEANPCVTFMHFL